MMRATKYIISFLTAICFIFTTYTAWGSTKYLYGGSTLTQVATTSVDDKATAVQMLKLAISINTTNGNNVTDRVSHLKVVMQNSTDADVSKARMYWTATSNSFSSNTIFGTTVLSPTGTITFTGPSDGFGTSTSDHYLWLIFDLNATGGGAGQTIDAYIPTDGLNIEETDNTSNVTYTPTDNNPTGSRTIIGGTGSSSGGGYYCKPSWTDYDAAWIENVTYTSINKSTGVDATDAFEEQTGTEGVILQGETYTIEVDIRSKNSNAYAWAYFDWNNDGDFADGAETVHIGKVTSTAEKLSKAFIVPTGASATYTRMRVSIEEAGTPTSDGCISEAAGVKGETEDYTILITEDADLMAFHSSTTTQTNTDAITDASTNNHILGMQVAVKGKTTAKNVTSMTFTTDGTTATASDKIQNAKLWQTGTSSSATAASTQLGVTDANINATFTIDGFTHTMSDAVQYFWLTFDEKTASAGDVVDAECKQIVYDGSAKVPTVTDPSGTRTVGGAMAYSDCNVTQGNTGKIAQGGGDRELLGINITTTGYATPVAVDKLVLNTTGSTNAANDISNAQLWTTGTSSTFAATTQIGFGQGTPSGNFTFDLSGQTLALENGVNYLWLTYDLDNGATAGNVVDAEAKQIVVASTNRSADATTTDPSGTREIAKAWDGSSSTSWATAANWVDGTKPSATQFVIIPNAGVTNYPTVDAAETCGGVEIESSASLTLDDGGAGGDFHLGGNFVNAGTFSNPNYTAEMVKFNSTATISNTGTIKNLGLRVVSGGNLTFGSAIDMDSFILNSGQTADFNDYNVTVSGTNSAVSNFQQVGTLYLGTGTFTLQDDLSTFTEATLKEETSTIVWDNKGDNNASYFPNSPTGGLTLYNLEVKSYASTNYNLDDLTVNNYTQTAVTSGGSVDIAVASIVGLNVNGVATIGANTTLDLSADALTLASTFHINGTLQGAAGSRVITDGSSAAEIDGWNDADIDLSISSTATVTLASAATIDLLDINTGTFIVKTATTSLLPDAGIVVDGGVFLVTGGKVNSTLATDLCIDINTGGKFQINGGTLEAFNPLNIDGGTLHVNGGLFTSVYNPSSGIPTLDQNGGTVQISSGEIKIGSASTGNSAYWDNTGGRVDVDGGTINLSFHYMQSSAGNGFWDQTAGTVNVGLYSGSSASTAGSMPNFSMDKGTFNMSGGTMNIYDGEVITNYEGFRLTPEATTITGGKVVLKQNATNKHPYELEMGNGTTKPQLWDLEIDHSGTTVDAINGFFVKNDLTITSGTLDHDTNEPAEVGGDWTNNGGYTTAAGSSVTLNGSGTQTISGSSGTTFHDLVLNSTGTIFMTTSNTVSGSMTFTDGLFKITAAKTLTLDAGDDPGLYGGGTASYFMPADTTARVKKTTDAITKHTFPFGDGTNYRPIKLTPTATAATAWVMSYSSSVHHDVTTTTGCDHPSKDEWFKVERASGSANVTMELSWDSNSNVDDYANLVIAHYDGTNWDDVAASTGGTNSAGTITSSGTITSFSPFSLGSSNSSNPLPINLIDFDAVINNGQVVDITWSTATEINNDYFTIERSTIGGDFEELTTVPGAGNSSSRKDYSIVDENPLPGTSYYRLTQTDYDGVFEVFNRHIATVIFNSSKFELLGIYPNPAYFLTIVSFNATENDIATIKLFNSTGQQVYTASQRTAKGKNDIELDLSEYSKGLYYVHLENNNQETINTKLIKYNQY